MTAIVYLVPVIEFYTSSTRGVPASGEALVGRLSIKQGKKKHPVVNYKYTYYFGNSPQISPPTCFFRL